jgi:hypothetical protein
MLTQPRQHVLRVVVTRIAESVRQGQIVKTLSRGGVLLRDRDAQDKGESSIKTSIDTGELAWSPPSQLRAYKYKRGLGPYVIVTSALASQNQSASEIRK